MKTLMLGIFFQVAFAQSLADKLVLEAHRLVEESEVSYVYGGAQYSEGKECSECNLCLSQKAPHPTMRLMVCSACRLCSIDCSHFTQLIFRNVGIPVPYLTTRQMLSTSKEELRKRYHFIEISSLNPSRGDLLVYKGHVVMLTSRSGAKGDIVHATGGKDIKLPGQGIQRERQVYWANFRGPLLRVLRHRDLAPSLQSRLLPVPKN